jgi:hypothetical protein
VDGFDILDGCFANHNAALITWFWRKIKPKLSGGVGEFLSEIHDVTPP